MKTRVAAALLIVTLVAAAAWWYTRARVEGQDLPAGALRGYNVLLVTIDTLRVDRVGAYGHAAGLTPTLDRLAAEGLRFDAVRAHAPLTLPSHASLMTGRIPPRHGVRDNGTYRLDPEQPTLASALKPAGYQTGAFVGAFVLDARFGLARGFDLYDDQYGRAAVGRPRRGRRTTGRTGDHARRRVDSRRGRALVRVGPPVRSARALCAAGTVCVEVCVGAVRRRSRVRGCGAWPDARRSAELPDGSIARSSSSRRITAKALGDHGERTHGLFAYDSTMRVPLIVWCRGRLQPRVIAEAAGLVDVAPTILDLLGISWSAVDGRSLRAQITGAEPSRRSIRADLLRSAQRQPHTELGAAHRRRGRRAEADRPAGSGALRSACRSGRNAESLRATARRMRGGWSRCSTPSLEAAPRRPAPRSTRRPLPGCVRSDTSRRSPPRAGASSRRTTIRRTSWRSISRWTKR